MAATNSVSRTLNLTVAQRVSIWWWPLGGQRKLKLNSAGQPFHRNMNPCGSVLWN